MSANWRNKCTRSYVIEAVSSRPPISETLLIRFGAFEVDLHGWVLRTDNKRVPLQKKPFQILRLLLSRPGELVSRAELARELWPELRVTSERCLNTAVNALRNALDDPPRQSRFIQTRPGLGYCFAGLIGPCISPDELPLNGAKQLDLSRLSLPSQVLFRQPRPGTGLL